MLQIELSIIIPVYNAEKYIKRCLQSILESSEKAIEVIVVDDGSKDASLNVCQEMAAADTRLRVFSKENGGVSSARNAGLERARGCYLTFCDADDYYEPGAIACLLAELRSREYDMVFFPFYLLPENRSKQLYAASDYPQTQLADIGYLQDHFWKLMNAGMMNSCCNHVFLNRRIQQMNLRFRTDMTFSEDGMFNVAYLRALGDTSAILYLARPLYNYVSNEGQATRKRVKNYFYMMCLAFDNIDAFIGTERKNNTYWKEWLSVIKDTCYHQNYVLANVEEMLSNDRTKEMIERYHPDSMQDRILIQLLKAGHMDAICRIYKTNSALRRLLKTLLKRGST